MQSGRAAVDPGFVSREKENDFIKSLQYAQSDNKKQYKKLADAMVKENQLNRVSEALTLDKMLKQKGKKQKVENENTGKVSYKWFSERKRWMRINIFN